MAAQLLDGKNMSNELREKLALRVENLKARGVTPGLAVILVGNDPASRVYVTGKEKDCAVCAGGHALGNHPHAGNDYSAGAGNAD